MNQELMALLTASLECSIFIEPTEPGLTYVELCEVAKRLGYLDGEIGDAFRMVNYQHIGNRYMPDAHTLASWIFFFPEDPEYRNFDALDFVVSNLNDRVRADGMRNAQMARRVLVERAIASNIQRHDIELSITYLSMAGLIAEREGVLRFAKQHGATAVPSAQLQDIGQGRAMRKETRARTYPFVKDIIERRSDDRPKHIEPFDAFANELDKLGYGGFRLWWKQTVSELGQAETNTSSVAISVLAAALVEGALTFIVQHARKHGGFTSDKYSKDPRSWKIDDLVASAASGGADAVFDMQTKNRVETLIRARQWIHAGRMLSDFPHGVADIRPEEARDARATAEQAVRRALDWLHKFPPI